MFTYGTGDVIHGRLVACHKRQATPVKQRAPYLEGTGVEAERREMEDDFPVRECAVILPEDKARYRTVRNDHTLGPA